MGAGQGKCKGEVILFFIFILGPGRRQEAGQG
jgi:hypothetical protein